MICGLVVVKIYKYEFRLYLRNLSRICKMGITFAYELGWKSFLYEKSSTQKVTSKFKHFQNPQKPNRKKLRSFQDLEAKKIQKNSNLLVAHRGCGAPLVIWPGSLKYFSKFHHSHEHEQSPRHQQGIIGLIC